MIDAVEKPSTENVPPAIFTEDSIAIRGADPVASFTEDLYVLGTARSTPSPSTLTNYELANNSLQWRRIQPDSNCVLIMNQRKGVAKSGYSPTLQ